MPEIELLTSTDATVATAIEAAAAPKSKMERLQDSIAVIQKRLAVDTAKLAELELQLTTVDRLASVVAGTWIVARLGRAGSNGEAGTIKHVNAYVMGINELDSGATRYKVSYGEGFDADVAVIQESQIIEILQVA